MDAVPEHLLHPIETVWGPPLDTPYFELGLAGERAKTAYIDDVNNVARIELDGDRANSSIPLWPFDKTIVDPQAAIYPVLREEDVLYRATAMILAEIEEGAERDPADFIAIAWNTATNVADRCRFVDRAPPLPILALPSPSPGPHTVGQVGRGAGRSRSGERGPGVRIPARPRILSDPSVRTPLGGAPPRDLSVPLGPASNMALVRADSAGVIRYTVSTYPERVFDLGERFAGATLGVVDTLRAAWLFDPDEDVLRAMIHFGTGEPRVFFFGRLWGKWMDESGALRDCDSPFDVMRSLRIPCEVDPRSGELRVEFNVNMHIREAFSGDAKRAFRDGYEHQLGISFDMPSGDFAAAKIFLTDRRKGGGGFSLGVRGFPLSWPREVYAPRKPGAPREEPRVEPPRDRPRAEHPAPSGNGKTPPPPEPPPEAQPLPRAHEPTPTPPESPAPARAKLRRPDAPDPEAILAAKIRATLDQSLGELTQSLEGESDRDARRRILEANFDLQQPARSYPLLLRHYELVADFTPDWHPDRLVSVFGIMPGGVLVMIMERWAVNQVLAVAEGNPEREKIMDWLRERELDRMLGLTIGREATDPVAARRDLGVDANADPPAIRKSWRTLLHFLNADLGRNEERAIHRKKDEIAKRLQVARDVLLKPL